MCDKCFLPLPQKPSGKTPPLSLWEYATNAQKGRTEICENSENDPVALPLALNFLIIALLLKTEQCRNTEKNAVPYRWDCSTKFSAVTFIISLQKFHRKKECLTYKWKQKRNEDIRKELQINNITGRILD